MTRFRGGSLLASLFTVVGCGSTGGETAGQATDGAPIAPDASRSRSDASASMQRPDASSTEPGIADASSGPDAVNLPEDAAWLGEAGAPRSFTIINQCPETVWAAALPAATFPGGPIAMAPGDAFQVGVANGWSGRIWGKTGCTVSGTKLSCVSDPFPSSLAELTLTSSATGLDFYDLSLVDGFNLPLEIVALGQTADPKHPYDCGNPTCAVDLNAPCPAELQDRADGGTVACANDACKALAGNDASSPDCQYPDSFTEFFKMACPTAYSYPSDDPTSTFTCKGYNDYAVVFCP